MSAANVKITRNTAAHEVEVKGEIGADALSSAYDAVLKDIQKTTTVDGFRTGHAPLERILAIYSEPMILERAAREAIQHELPEILAKEKLMIIAAPQVALGTPQKGAPLPFTARAPLIPSITLPDYKAIAKKISGQKEDIAVTDAEHAEASMHIRRERARIDKVERGMEPQQAATESRAMAEGDLPELDDAFVATLGYEHAAAFADALRANIKNEKELHAREKRRVAILEELVKQSDISYPAILRTYELDDMEANLKDDLTRAGATLERYLTEIEKTRDELRAAWADAADKRAKIRLILSEIARLERIEPDEAALAREIAHAKQHYKNTDEATLRAHIAHAMRNEAVLRSLEGDSQEDEKSSAIKT